MSRKGIIVIATILSIASFLFCGCGGGGGGGGSVGSVNTAPSHQTATATPSLTPSPSAGKTIPVVTDVQPRTLKPGDTCTVTGENFGNENGSEALHTVEFGDIPSTVYSEWSDTKIVCTVPADVPAGTIAVTVKISDGTSVYESADFPVSLDSTF